MKSVTKILFISIVLSSCNYREYYVVGVFEKNGVCEYKIENNAARDRIIDSSCSFSVGDHVERYHIGFKKIK